MKQEIIVERLIECRKKTGLSQAEAAEKIGVSQPAYQRYEAGARTPSVQVVKEIAKAFNTSVAYLTGGSDTISSDYIVIDREESPLLFSMVEQCKECSEEQLKQLVEYFRRMQK